MAQIVLASSLLFSLWLIVQDIRRRKAVSMAVWVPTLLLMILSSRHPQQWITGGIVNVQEMGNDAASSPLDAGFFLLTILVSAAIAIFRGVRWLRIFASNKFLMALYLYFLVSAAWSGDPVGSIKRLFKDFGLIFVASVLFSENDPLDAIRAIYYRSAALLFPLSIVFTKYYPDYGRAYTVTGDMMFTGVTTQKNSLGEIVLFFTLFLLWDCLQPPQPRRVSKWIIAKWDRIALILIGLRLLQLSQSKTAMLCIIVGGALLLRGRWMITKPINRFAYVSAISLPFLVFFSQEFSSIIAPVVESMGRNMTFTGRTDIWNQITIKTVNPLLGAGYWNFWGGPGGYAISLAMRTVVPNAHCGYVDMYLDGGTIGLVLLFLMLTAYAALLTRQMSRTDDAQRYLRMRFVILIVAIIYNLSESTFFRIGPLWFTFLLMLITFPASAKPAKKVTVETPQKEAAPAPEYVSQFARLTAIVLRLPLATFSRSNAIAISAANRTVPPAAPMCI